MTQTDEYASARRRAEAKYGFLVHAAVYAGVMVLLVVINLATSPGYRWFVWPLLGWGFAVALHGVRVFLLSDSGDIVDALTERELRRRGAGQGEDGLPRERPH